MTILEAPTGPAVDMPAPAPRWSLTWRGAVYREDDLNVSHASILAALRGEDSWRSVDVLHPADGPLSASMVLMAFLIADRVSDDMDADAIARVTAETVQDMQAVPLAEIAAAIGTY